ncbi:MAG: hypothetical protein IJR78_00230 [Clostridia bacterium]|nr:hypothetical protein [Clostridia bacterium]
MDKMSMEELGFFLYMEEMERRQREEQEAQAGEDRPDFGEDEDAADPQKERDKKSKGTADVPALPFVFFWAPFLTKKRGDSFILPIS